MTELLLISYLVMALMAVMAGHIWRRRAKKYLAKADSYRDLIADQTQTIRAQDAVIDKLTKQIDSNKD